MTLAAELIILVVEDHDFQRRTMARMLRSLGVSKVLEANNGKNALTLMQNSEEVDIVVCDLDMPEMDGMELIRHLGQSHSKVSVIISTAQERSLLASVEKMAHAYNVHLIGVIEKPITLHGLEDLISRHDTFKLQPKPVSIKAPIFSLDQILQGVQQKQFEIFFQPKADLQSGQILGAEALARWRHPEQGIICPYSFIAPLEQSGNINDLTFIILEKAGNACRNWRKRGFPLTISVNLSIVSLIDPTFADKIIEIIKKIDLDQHYMILEITETVAMTNVAPALENLTRLRMHGFNLSIDDYGTGFSSMQQLTRIPFTELKIDQSFVRNCTLNSSLADFVKSSVKLARQLKIKSVAEGVETNSDWDMVKTIGCDIAQGFFISEAIEESLFLEFCKTKS